MRLCFGLGHSATETFRELPQQACGKKSVKLANSWANSSRNSSFHSVRNRNVFRGFVGSVVIRTYTSRRVHTSTNSVRSKLRRRVVGRRERDGAVFCRQNHRRTITTITMQRRSVRRMLLFCFLLVTSELRTFAR